MAKKHVKQQDIINGRISLLFFGLLLYAGLLWLIRQARYRYDLIFRPMLPWLMPICFGAVAIAFLVLLILWLKGGRKESGKLISLPFLLSLLIPLMAAFFFPWLTLFANGLQFFRLATEVLFYAALGGFIGYIGSAKCGPAAGWLASAFTLDILALFYFYDRFLSPTSFILNTQEFGYMADWAVALILMGVAALWNLAVLLLTRKAGELKGWALLLPAALTLLLLGLTAFIPFGITPLRCMIFGGIGLIFAWYIAWCALKNKAKI